MFKRGREFASERNCMRLSEYPVISSNGTLPDPDPVFSFDN